MSRPRLDVATRPPAAPARPLRVLVVEAGSDHTAQLEASLDEAVAGEVELRAHATLAAARSDLRSGGFDCVLLDVSRPDANGLESLAKVRSLAPEAPVVVLSGPEDEELAVQAVHEGAQDYLVGRGADGSLLARSIRYATERMRSELDLARLAFYDPLTRLPNRKLVIDRLGLALAAAERSGRLAALLLLDLDHFRLVNESLGHDVGDSLLREVATRLTELVRPGDTVALLIDGLELYVGASTGIAFGECRRSPEALIRDTEQAMYRAKERGSRYAVFEHGGEPRPGCRLGLETELRHALRRDEFRLVYQPELDCGDGRIFGVEALLRWRHPHRGVVTPGDFIPAAEETGLIVRIGEWVILEATRQLADWRRAGLCAPDLIMSVNVSPRQLVDSGLPAAVRSALDASELPADRLCLELTESTVAADPARVLSRLEELRALGVSLSLDDFGTGVSSLSVLSGYPVDTLKVDRSFVAQLSDGLKHRRLFASVVGVAHALGIRALAEGVETREQLEEIHEAGCDAAQGFFVGRPVAASELVAKLRGYAGSCHGLSPVR
ncbi:MAG: EAL domain-containing protein [Thermoleophilaceae bacterium]|nr:EAL domain-containing protein [Thermoleophilaceae bacterium]